jgi:hypothetical protein
LNDLAVGDIQLDDPNEEYWIQFNQYKLPSPAVFKWVIFLFFFLMRSYFVRKNAAVEQNPILTLPWSI